MMAGSIVIFWYADKNKSSCLMCLSLSVLVCVCMCALCIFVCRAILSMPCLWCVFVKVYVGKLFSNFTQGILVESFKVCLCVRMNVTLANFSQANARQNSIY